MIRRRALQVLLAGPLALCVGALGLGLALLDAEPAGAQTGSDEPVVVVATNPGDGEVLTAAPPDIVLTFANTLPDIDAVIQLQNSNRELLNTGQPIAFNNRTALRVRVLEQRGLPAGTYTVTWLVRPRNEKPISGKFAFTLEAPDGATSGTDVTSDTTPEKIDTGGLGLAKSNHSGGFLGLIGRILTYIGLAGLAGGLILVLLAWPEGVEYVLTVRHLVLMWGLAALGSLLLVATAAADAEGISVARGLLPTEWNPVLDTSYGKALVIRFLAIAVSLWVARRPERIIDASSRWMAVGGPGIALATYGWSRHPEGLIAVPFGIAHMIAIAAWFGGAMLLTRVVLAGPGEGDLSTAVRKFRGIAIPALALSLLTGVVEVALRLGGLRNLLNTGYGRLFVLKVLAVAAMAFIGTANRQYARQRLARSRMLGPRASAKLRKSVRSEVLAGGLALLLTAGLIASNAPGSASADPTSGNKDTFTSEDGTFKAEVTFGPKRVGAQVELHFRLVTPDEISNGLITLTPNDADVASIEIPIEGQPRYGFGPEQGFVFPASGTWTITITASGPDGELPTVGGQFVVRNQDGTTPTPTSSTLVPETTRATVPDTTDGVADSSAPPAN